MTEQAHTVVGDENFPESLDQNVGLGVEIVVAAIGEEHRSTVDHLVLITQAATVYKVIRMLRAFGERHPEIDNALLEEVGNPLLKEIAVEAFLLGLFGAVGTD